jgi:hypothetical protein
MELSRSRESEMEEIMNQKLNAQIVSELMEEPDEATSYELAVTSNHFAFRRCHFDLKPRVMTDGALAIDHQIGMMLQSRLA